MKKKKRREKNFYIKNMLILIIKLSQISLLSDFKNKTKCCLIPLNNSKILSLVLHSIPNFSEISFANLLS